MDPTVAAALIAALAAGGVAVVGFVTNAWTTSRTLEAARAASLRDRQASVFQQILAFGAHRNETRRMLARNIKYGPKSEARLHEVLGKHSPRDWFDLEGYVFAFCPDSVVVAFRNAKNADDAVYLARAAYKEAAGLNEAEPNLGDSDDALPLQAEFRTRIEDAEKADSRLMEIVRDKMLSTRPPEAKPTMFGPMIASMRSRASLRR